LNVGPNSAPSSLVSVVVPTFNGTNTICQTLQAIAAQRHARVEIIVVDDGSTDQTIPAIQDSGVAVTLLRQTNSGVCRARNSGAAAAHGDYICFVDQDDIWHPDHLRAQLMAFDRWPSAGVAVSPYQYWPIGKPRTREWLREVKDFELDDRYCGWVFHEFMLDCWALTSASLLKRNVWINSGGFDLSLEFGEDWGLPTDTVRQAAWAIGVVSAAPDSRFTPRALGRLPNTFVARASRTFWTEQPRWQKPRHDDIRSHDCAIQNGVWLSSLGIWRRAHRQRCLAQCVARPSGVTPILGTVADERFRSFSAATAPSKREQDDLTVSSDTSGLR
jgi:glycosyltransferase involved in cell wall biosynthesis